MEPIEQKIASYIRLHCRGKINAMTAATLARIFETNERTFRDIIHSLRVNHDLGEIVSDTSAGFWWSDNFEEVEHCIANTLSRRDELTSLLKSYHHARERLQPKPPQRVLELATGNPQLATDQNSLGF